MTNETLETIKSRRSCRAYKPEQITDEELNAVLEAGTYAASAMGRQSAKIVVVQDAAAREKLSRMNAAIMGKDCDPMYGAPTILVVLADANAKCAVHGRQPCHGQPDAGRRLAGAGQLLGSTAQRKSLKQKRARPCSGSGASRAIGSASATAFWATLLQTPKPAAPRKPDYIVKV